MLYYMHYLEYKHLQQSRNDIKYPQEQLCVVSIRETDKQRVVVGREKRANKQCNKQGRHDLEGEEEGVVVITCHPSL